MKFWKSLSNLIEETLPDWRDKFLSYKDLKKQLKLICPKVDENPNKRARSDGGDGEASDVTKEVTNFVRLLEAEIEKFNAFFVDQEEEYVIKLKELQDEVARVKESKEELMKIGTEIVDFHGEMVLLENYSALNYTGLVKILKKYEKRSGTLIRLPFIQKVLQEPFFETELLNKLVKECETMVDQLFSMNEPSPSSSKPIKGNEASAETKESLLKGPKELAEIEHMESMYQKLALSALRVLKEIRSGSSTVSTFSLPPLQTSPREEIWKKITVLEQAAK